MTSSSSRSTGRVIRGSDAGYAAPLSTPDLRSGTWTRMGDEAVLGDDHTELVLSGLADRARVAAEAQGYADGWAKGVRDALQASAAQRAEDQAAVTILEAALETDHRAVVQAFRRAADALDDAASDTRGRLEQQAVELALAVTETVLGEAAARAVPEDVVRRALEVLPESGIATVRLHPAVAETADVAGLPGSVRIVPDPTLRRSDAVVELDDHLVDLRVDTAVARVREALR